MTATDWLQKRQSDWEELERLLLAFESRSIRRQPPEMILRLGRLYRGACADLAMSEGYNLADATVHHLHQLVARAHNQVYRANNSGTLSGLSKKLFVEVPKLVVCDPCVAIAFALFWGCFFLAMFASYTNPRFAEAAVGPEMLGKMEEMYSQPISGRASDANSQMAGFYVQHNTGIGFTCFAAGVFLGIGSMFALVFNAIVLGAVFGHMTGTPMSNNFFHFVTAHSVCELTAIVLSAAAGLRMGFSLVDAKGRRRMDALQQEGRQALKIVGLAAVLFVIAAFIEGFVSPSALPYPVKLAVAVASAVALAAYIFILGLKARQADAA